MTRLILLWILCAASGLAFTAAAADHRRAEAVRARVVAMAEKAALAWSAEFGALLEPNLAPDAMPGVAELLTPLIDPASGITGAALLLRTGQPVATRGIAPAMPPGLIAALFDHARGIGLETGGPAGRSVIGDRSLGVAFYDWTGLIRGVLVLGYDAVAPSVFVPWPEGLALFAAACALRALPRRRVGSVASETLIALSLAVALGAASFEAAVRIAGVAPDRMVWALVESAAIAVGTALVFRQVAFPTAPPAAGRGLTIAAFLAGCASASALPMVCSDGLPATSIVAAGCGIVLGVWTAAALSVRYGWRVAGLPGGCCGLAGSALFSMTHGTPLTVVVSALIGIGAGLAGGALRDGAGAARRRPSRHPTISPALAGQITGLALGSAGGLAFGQGATIVVAAGLWFAVTGAILTKRNDEGAALRFLLHRLTQPDAAPRSARLRSQPGASIATWQARVVAALAAIAGLFQPKPVESTTPIATVGTLSEHA